MLFTIKAIATTVAESVGPVLAVIAWAGIKTMITAGIHGVANRLVGAVRRARRSVYQRELSAGGDSQLDA